MRSAVNGLAMARGIDYETAHEMMTRWAHMNPSPNCEPVEARRKEAATAEDAKRTYWSLRKRFKVEDYPESPEQYQAEEDFEPAF